MMSFDDGSPCTAAPTARGYGECRARLACVELSAMQPRIRVWPLCRPHDRCGSFLATDNVLRNDRVVRDQNLKPDPVGWTPRARSQLVSRLRDLSSRLVA